MYHRRDKMDGASNSIYSTVINYSIKSLMRFYLIVAIFITSEILQAQNEMNGTNIPVSKHAVSIEMLGRGILGGIYYEHALWQDVLHTQASLGSGIGIMPLPGANPMILPPRSNPPIALPIIPIYLNIIPQITRLQPQFEAVRFYLEPGLWLSPLPFPGYLATGIRFKKDATGLWGRMGVIFFQIDSGISTDITSLPSFTLGWAF